jgi:hypothetical protein
MAMAMNYNMSEVHEANKYLNPGQWPTNFNQI